MNLKCGSARDDLLRAGAVDEPQLLPIASQIIDPLQARWILATAEPHLAHQAQASFVECYAVVADRPDAKPSEQKIDKESLALEGFRVARHRTMRQRLRNSGSVSTEAMRIVLKAAVQRDLLGPGGGADFAERGHAFASELGARLHKSANERGEMNP